MCDHHLANINRTSFANKVIKRQKKRKTLRWLKEISLALKGSIEKFIHEEAPQPKTKN